MEELKDKLQFLILSMSSKRRERLCLYCDWEKVSRSFLEGVFNLDDWCILQKDGKQVCFTIIHEEGCDEEFSCSCTETVANPHIKVYYLSDLFTQMISVSHFQPYFSGKWRPKVLADIIDGINVSSEHLELLESLRELCREHGDADYEEFEKEESPDFQRMLNEFKSLICEYLMLAFTNPTSLPPFLLDSEGPTMRLSELIAWLKSE